VVGKTSCDKKVVKKKLGPGAIIGEMGLLLGGFRKADVVACASGDDEDDFGNVLGNEEALGMRRDAGASSTLCVRIYFDAFVDFFAKHPDLATRAFGSLTNTATSRLKRWLLVEKEGREKKDTEENSEKENSNVSRRSPKLAETLDARRVYLALSGIADRENCFCQLHSEKDKKAFASVAAVVDANRHETVFSSGTVASKFGIVLKGTYFPPTTFRLPDCPYSYQMGLLPLPITLTVLPLPITLTVLTLPITLTVYVIHITRD
jgi:CRP-like cAMP-binding protein